MKLDLTGVRRMSAAELVERRHRRSEGKPPGTKRFKKKYKIKAIKIRRHRTTIVTSVSIKPELRYRAARDLGEGSFTKAVVRSLTKALADYDRENS